jgi:predicted permease
MFDTINNVIIPYISGLWTLPWIVIGLIVTILVARVTGRERIDKLMKKIGLIILYFFVPVLIFRIFLNTPFGENEINFSILVSIIILLMYILAYAYAKYLVKKQKMKGKTRDLFVKTMLTNQGRSSAFIGSMMLAVDVIRVYAAIFMALVGIALFAIIPFILSYLHSKETKNSKKETVNPLPWYLRLYPWYLIIFVILGVILQYLLGPQAPMGTPLSIYLLGPEANTLLYLYTAITIPAALYYVGAGIHPKDLKKEELRKLIGLDKEDKGEDHWNWVRKIFVLTVIITPLIITFIFGSLYVLSLLPLTWFAVIIINAFLPITSTNMFLLPYGIDKKTTAHVVTWTTLVCVPLVVAMIIGFGLLLGQ